MEVLGVLLAPTANLQGDLGAPVMEDAQASAETNLQGVGELTPTRPSPGRETPDTTMEALPGIESEGDGNAGCAEEKGASPPPSASARCAQGERGMDLDDANPAPVEPPLEAERLDLSWLGRGPEPSMPWTTYAQVKKEKDQLARKFDALQATIPEAQTTKVMQLIQLKTNMAKLQYENARLARRAKVTHEENVRLGATLAAQPTSGGPAQHPQVGTPAPDGQPSEDGTTAPGAQRSELDWIEQSETIERLRAEKSHLARRLVDLIAVVPAAIAARVTRIQQLEERAAQHSRKWSSCAGRGKCGRPRYKKTLRCARCWGQRK